MNNSTPVKTAESKTPTHIAYHVSDRFGSDAFWTRIGSAWANADGQGFNIQFDTIPLNGRVTLRIPSEKTQ